MPYLSCPLKASKSGVRRLLPQALNTLTSIRPPLSAAEMPRFCSLKKNGFVSAGFGLVALDLNFLSASKIPRMACPFGIVLGLTPHELMWRPFIYSLKKNFLPSGCGGSIEYRTKNRVPIEAVRKSRISQTLRAYQVRMGYRPRRKDLHPRHRQACAR